MARYEEGKIYRAEVTYIETYGAFVKLEDNYNGLIHISEISNKYVSDINNFFKVGDYIYVEVLEVDEKLKQIKLSIRNINYKGQKAKKNKKAIEETPHGFNTLRANLPIWINKKLKNIEKEKITLDKR